MKLNPTLTSPGYGQIFNPAPVDFSGLGSVVKRLLDSATPDVQVQVTGMANGAIATLAAATSFVIAILSGATAAALKTASTQYAIGDLTGRTTYDLNAFTSSNNEVLGSLGEDSVGGAIALSILSLMDGFVADSHSVGAVQSVVIDQPNSRVLMKTDGDFSAAVGVDVNHVATFSKGSSSFME